MYRCGVTPFLCGTLFLVLFLIILEEFVMRRHKVSRRHSKRVFKHHARKTHVKNLHSHPMRGGFRI